MKIRCPGCKKLYTVDSRYAGHKATCKQCGTKFPIPQVEATAPASPGSGPAKAASSEAPPRVPEAPPPPQARQEDAGGMHSRWGGLLRSRRAWVLGGSVLAAIAVVLVVVLVRPGLPLGSSMEPGPVLASADQLRKAERALEQRAATLVRSLRSTKANTRYDAKLALMRMRPLPSAAVPPLVDCLQAPDRAPRKTAALLLGYHQVKNEQALAAVRKAVSATDDDKAAGQLQVAAERLAAAQDPLPVLADSAAFSNAVEQAILRVAKTPGRAFSRWQIASGGTIISASVGPMWSDLPETVTVSTSGKPCKVVLGWKWETNLRRGKWSADPVPIGAFARLRTR